MRAPSPIHKCRAPPRALDMKLAMPRWRRGAQLVVVTSCKFGQLSADRSNTAQSEITPASSNPTSHARVTLSSLAGSGSTWPAPRRL
jgi:hypothetical protein